MNHLRSSNVGGWSPPAVLVSSGLVAVVIGCAAFGCSAGEVPVDGGGGTRSDGVGVTGGSGTDSDISLGTGGSATMGKKENCVKLATWGALGEWGAVPGRDGQDAITAWLNETSTGEAEYFPQKPQITTDSLSRFDVIILQDLAQWTFSSQELMVFEEWVRAGGGVMSLQGYSDQPTEAHPTNELLAFSGMQYAGLSGAGDISTSAANEDGCAYCLGNSDRQGGWISEHPISANISLVGAFHGRSIDPGGVGRVVAKWDGLVAGATVEVGEGRIFMFHDEWVTYSSQWDGTTLMEDCRTVDQYHSCYGVHPTTSYQIPQFWYNSIRWVSNAGCFDIQDEAIVK